MNKPVMPEPTGWLVRYGVDGQCWSAYRDKQAADDTAEQWRGTVEPLYSADQLHAFAATLEARLREVEKDAARLDYIERTFSGMTNRERYLPVQMIWGKGTMGRTLREACDKYMARDTAREGERREGA